MEPIPKITGVAIAERKAMSYLIIALLVLILLALNYWVYKIAGVIGVWVEHFLKESALRPLMVNDHLFFYF